MSPLVSIEKASGPPGMGEAAGADDAEDLARPRGHAQQGGRDAAGSDTHLLVRDQATESSAFGQDARLTV